jgi:hypothetical protein
VLAEVAGRLGRIPFDDHARSIAEVAIRLLVCPTPRISCEAVPACCRDGAGMRRHLNESHPGLPCSGAAESFVSFIPLLGCFLAPGSACSCVRYAALLRPNHTPS